MLSAAVFITVKVYKQPKHLAFMECLISLYPLYIFYTIIESHVYGEYSVTLLDEQRIILNEQIRIKTACTFATNPFPSCTGFQLLNPTYSLSAAPPSSLCPLQVQVQYDRSAATGVISSLFLPGSLFVDHRLQRPPSTRILSLSSLFLP